MPHRIPLHGIVLLLPLPKRRMRLRKNCFCGLVGPYARLHIPHHHVVVRVVGLELLQDTNVHISNNLYTFLRQQQVYKILLPPAS